MFLIFTLLSFIQQINTTEILGVDFYQLVGLQKTDDQKAVVRSFKRFISQKRRHPTNNERTLKLWRQTQLAYDIIGNPDSRSLYDSLGPDFVNVTNFRVVGYNSDAALEVLRQMFGSQFPPEMENYGGIIFYPLQFDIVEFLTGSERMIRVFRQGKCICSNGHKKCAECRRNPYREEVVEQKIEIPPGATEFHRIIAKGLGDAGKGRGAADIVFVVYCKPDPLFKRDGPDVSTNLSISLATALNGGTVSLENFDGNRVEIDIEAGIQHGEIRRIPNQGLPYYLDNTKRGDLIVQFSIDFPEHLTDEQKSVIQEVLPDDDSLYE